MTSAPKISIVIVSLNGEQRMPMCLKALRQTDYPILEIIVVDNGSADKTSEVSRELCPDAIILRSEKNLGFAGGNNLGIEKATGEIIILLNDDCEPHPDWLKAMIAAASDLTDWGILGCKLLYPDSNIIQHAGAVLEPNGLTKHVGYMEEDTGQYDEIKSYDYVTGAAFAIHRKVIDKIGMLDADYFPIYFEENDYCARAKKAGFGIYYIPQSVVVHHESMTTKKLSFGFLCKYHRNRLHFIIKNFSGAEIRRAIRREIGWLLRHRSWDQFWPLLLSYLHTLAHLLTLLKARRENLQ